MQTTARSSSQKARRRRLLWRHHWRAWVPFIVWGAPFAALYLLFIAAPLYMGRDTRAAVLHSENGVVVEVVTGPVTRGNWSPAATVTARAGSRTLYYSTYSAVHTGQAVRLQYRVGRSGRVYVEDAELIGP